MLYILCSTIFITCFL